MLPIAQHFHGLQLDYEEMLQIMQLSHGLYLTSVEMLQIMQHSPPESAYSLFTASECCILCNIR